MKFVPLKVLAVVHETKDAYTIKFENADREAFQYLPGQYLTLKVPYQGEELRRAFSLSSCPDEDDFLSVTIKAIPDGRVSNKLKNELKAGDIVDVMPPLGNFTAEVGSSQRHYVLIGGGSGITPLFSILRTVLLKEAGSKVTLIYANRDEESIIFRKELEQRELESGGQLKVVHVLDQPSAGWAGQSGLLTVDLAKTLLEQAKGATNLTTEYYMCGPTPMMDNIGMALEQMGIDEGHIHREYYSAPLSDGEEEQIDYELKDRNITVQLDGRDTEVAVPAGTNILDAAIDAHLDPPYACQEGICSTCRALVHDGLVQMVEREGLSDEEVEAGYVLTCQCFPLSDNVKLEYC